MFTGALFFFLFLRFYLFIFREGKGGKEEKKHQCDCLSHAPYWGYGPQPRYVPLLGIESVTLWFAGQHSIYGATPARAIGALFLTAKNCKQSKCPSTDEWMNNNMV